MKTAWLARSIVCVLLLGLFACGGGGGGGDGSAGSSVGGGGGVGSSSGPSAPIADLTGTWTVNEAGVSNCPGKATYTDGPYQVTVTQTGNNLTVVTPAGTFTGTIDGDDVAWSGSYPKDGGTVTISTMALTAAANGNSFSGSSTWRWTGGGSACSGTTQAINGTRVTGTGPVPAVPAGLAAAAQSSSAVSLSWNGGPVVIGGYKVERSLSATSGFTQIVLLQGPSTTYTDSGLAPNTTYHYRVRAYNSNGDSGYSSVADATTLSASSGAPLPPSNLTATGGSNSAALSWTDNANNETGFSIERSTNATTGFVQVVPAAANATSFTDTGLASATTYYYRVRATNATANSAYSNTAGATTAPTASAPGAPTNLVAAVVSSSSIQLTWTDNANNETGFRIERSTSATSGFGQVGVVGANATSFASIDLSPGTTYYFRVRATNANASPALDSGYSNTANATTATPPNFTLAVAKAGSGSGTVTSSPSGITCGADCNQQYASGTDVTLTATAATGSTFSSWSGCDAVSGATCTVDLAANRTVTATFNSAIATNITVSVPASSNTGNYTVSWTLSSGLASTLWTIQESPNTSFASVTTLTSSDTTSPFQLTFTNKTDGIYCYRVLAPGTTATFSAPACITVARATTGVLHVVNNTKYDMIDIRLNNTQHAFFPNGLLIGQSFDFVFTSAGTVNYALGVGFYNSDQSRNIWFTLNGTTSVTLGNVTTVTFNNPTIEQFLSVFQSSALWSGLYFDANQGPHTAAYRFSNNGTWAFLDDGRQTATGSVFLVSWPDYASIVAFKLCATCPRIDIFYPFGSFAFRNGPPSWPNIEYVLQ